MKNVELQMLLKNQEIDFSLEDIVLENNIDNISIGQFQKLMVNVDNLSKLILKENKITKTKKFPINLERIASWLGFNIYNLDFGSFREIKDPFGRPFVPKTIIGKSSDMANIYVDDLLDIETKRICIAFCMAQYIILNQSNVETANYSSGCILTNEIPNNGYNDKSLLNILSYDIAIGILIPRPVLEYLMGGISLSTNEKISDIAKFFAVRELDVHNRIKRLEFY